MTANSGERDRRTPVPAPPERSPGGIPADTFAVRLVLVRHYAGRLSIEQAAGRCGINPETWRRWEDGAKPRDKVESAQLISDTLGINFHWLLFGGELAGRRPVGQEETHRYPDAPNVRPPDRRPPGRAQGRREGHPAGPGQRRPIKLRLPEASLNDQSQYAHADRLTASPGHGLDVDSNDE